MSSFVCRKCLKPYTATGTSHSIHVSAVCGHLIGYSCLVEIKEKRKCYECSKEFREDDWHPIYDIPDEKRIIAKRQQYHHLKNFILYIRIGKKKPEKFSHLQYLYWPREEFPQPWVLTPINIYLRIKDSQRPVIIYFTS
uniref:RING-type domain-containing protein n=1 Tax=Strongyloides papillosus TaxID=174720 RepID=A0A0N5C7P3_STREA